jgi:hypothetical protein
MNTRKEEKLIFYSGGATRRYFPSRKQIITTTDSQFSTQSNFFNASRSPNSKRDATTPIFSLRKNESPNISVPGARVSSFDRPHDSSEDFRSDFEALKRSYQRLVEENMTLRSDKSLHFGESSVSTVALDRENEQIVQAYALEIEELYEIAAESHKAVQEMLEKCGKVHQEFAEIKKQANHLKFTQDLQDYTKTVKINLVRGKKLQETLNKKVEEIKLMTRDKKRVEIALKETEAAKREAESDIRVKDAKLKSIETAADPEIANAADLYYKLALANANLAISEKKAAKYERYIQTNFKDRP